MADRLKPHERGLLEAKTVVDEPGRHIVIGEAHGLTLKNGSLYHSIHYYGQRNRDGVWVDLQPHGHRIPADW